MPAADTSALIKYQPSAGHKNGVLVSKAPVGSNVPSCVSKPGAGRPDIVDHMTCPPVPAVRTCPDVPLRFELS